MDCYCCSFNDFSSCCKPFIDGDSYPKTAEQLMRSRYTAFCLNNNIYLKNTSAKEAKTNNSLTDLKNHDWLSLEIINTSHGLENDKHGTVEFKAFYTQNNHRYYHHELSEFEKINGQWRYTHGYQF